MPPIYPRLWILINLGSTSCKKMFSFGHSPNYLSPPPLPPIRATCTNFFKRQKRRFSHVPLLISNRKPSKTKRVFYGQGEAHKKGRYAKILGEGRETYYSSWKTVQSLWYLQFWRNRLILLAKNAVGEKGSTNSGKGLPPPFRAMPERKHCLQEVLPYFVWFNSPCVERITFLSLKVSKYHIWVGVGWELAQELFGISNSCWVEA